MAFWQLELFGKKVFNFGNNEPRGGGKLARAVHAQGERKRGQLAVNNGGKGKLAFLHLIIRIKVAQNTHTGPFQHHGLDHLDVVRLGHGCDLDACFCFQHANGPPEGEWGGLE